MNQLFTDFFHLGLMASIMTVIVLGIRTFFRRIPKIYTYILWVFVFIRAALPISYSSPFSLWTLLGENPLQALSQKFFVQTAADYVPYAGTYAIQNPPKNMPDLSSTAFPAFDQTAPDITAIAAILWAIGFLAILFLNVTYTWKDGSIIFHMQYRKQDNIWVPFKRYMPKYSSK